MNINITLIGQMITFMLFVWFCMKYVWPPIIKALDERQKKIADGLAAADRGEKELEIAQHKAKEIIQESKAQAAAILEQANQRAHHTHEEAKQEALQITQRMKQAAEEEVKREVVQAKQELKSQVATLAVSAAQKLIAKNIDEAADKELLDQLAEQV